MNDEFCFRSRFCTCKAILGRGHSTIDRERRNEIEVYISLKLVGGKLPPTPVYIALEKELLNVNCKGHYRTRRPFVIELGTNLFIYEWSQVRIPLSYASRWCQIL